MKNWTTRLLVFILFFLALLSAYNYFEKPFSKNNQEAQITQADPTPAPTKTPKRELSDKEKITQLLMVPLDINDLDEESSGSAEMLDFIEESKTGFVLYFGEKISTSSALSARKKINDLFVEDDYLPLVAVDHEGGLVQRLNGSGFTKMDSWETIVDDYSIAQQKAVFNQSGRELYSVGVNIVFAPVVDLASNSAVLKTRAATDIENTLYAATNFIYSFSQNGIMAVLKHFPGIGAINKDPHNAVSTITLREDDTAIFSQLLDKFPNIGVMTTHVRLTDKLDGEVCSLSADCLSQFPESYPDVVLFSDDLSMKSALVDENDNDREISEAAIAALRAGNNILVFGRGVKVDELNKIVYSLQKEYKDSESFRKAVDGSVAKVLNMKK